MNFFEVFTGYNWKSIRSCPGRYVLDPADQKKFNHYYQTLEGVREYKVKEASDPVLVCSLKDGGIISFRHNDGFFVHTLNNSDGFFRKLNQLGIEDQDFSE